MKFIQLKIKKLKIESAVQHMEVPKPDLAEMDTINRFGVSNRELFQNIKGMINRAKKLEDVINNDERLAKLDHIS